MKTWEIAYKGHAIRVENRWFRGERLLIDGQLHDEQTGFCVRSRLQGTIKDGEGLANL